MEAKCKKCRFAALCLPIGKQAFINELARPEYTVRGNDSGALAQAMVDAVDCAICKMGRTTPLDAVAILKNELKRYGVADDVEIVLEER